MENSDRKPNKNDIPEDVLLKAELMAKFLFKSKPIANGELRKKYDRESKLQCLSFMILHSQVYKSLN